MRYSIMATTEARPDRPHELWFSFDQHAVHNWMVGDWIAEDTNYKAHEIVEFVSPLPLDEDRVERLALAFIHNIIDLRRTIGSAASRRDEITGLIREREELYWTVLHMLPALKENKVLKNKTSFAYHAQD